jgi:hypothetical protein
MERLANFQGDFPEELGYLEKAAQRRRAQVYGRLSESLVHVSEEDLARLHFLLTALTSRDLFDGYAARVLTLLAGLVHVEQGARVHLANLETQELARVLRLG